jgi:hypothetical protein
MQKRVLKFRKQLCKKLLYHPWNRIDPAEFRTKLGITLKRKLPGITDLTIEGQSCESEEEPSIEEPQLTDTKMDDSSQPSEEEPSIKEPQLTDTKMDDSEQPDLSVDGRIHARESDHQLTDTEMDDSEQPDLSVDGRIHARESDHQYQDDINMVSSEKLLPESEKEEIHVQPTDTKTSQTFDEESKGSEQISPEKKHGEPTNIESEGSEQLPNHQKKMKRGKSNKSSQDLISPVLGKRCTTVNLVYTSLRKVRKHKFTSVQINNEIFQHILNQ